MADVTRHRAMKSFSRSAVSLSMVTLLARALTFVIQVIIADLFGASLETDMYFAGESMILLFANLIVTGFGMAFIPIWTEYRVRHGKAEADRFTNAFVSFAAVVGFVAGAAMVLGAPLVSRAIVPGFSPQALVAMTRLLGVMVLAIIPLGLTAGCTSLLEAHQRFLIPAFSRVAYSAVLLVFMLAAARRLGIVALAWGMVLAAVVRLLTQWIGARRLGGFSLTWKLCHPGVGRVMRLILPILIGLVGIEVTSLLDNVLASLLPAGALTGLTYANRVILLPIGILALPLRTTIFPTLSQQAAHRQLDDLGETAVAGMRLLALIMVPVAAALFVLRYPLISLLFERGAFDSQAVHTTASALGWYALSVPAMGSLMIIGNIYFSLSDPAALVRLNLISWAGNAVLSLALLGPLGHKGIALGTSLAYCATWALAIFGLRRRFPNMGIMSFASGLGKALLATGAMVGAMLGANALLSGTLDVRITALPLRALVALLLGSSIGIVTYLAAAWALQVKEMRTLASAVLRWVPLGS